MCCYVALIEQRQRWACGIRAQPTARRAYAPQPTLSWVSSVRQKAVRGSEVTPAASIIGWISSRVSEKKVSKLC